MLPTVLQTAEDTTDKREQQNTVVDGKRAWVLIKAGRLAH